MTWTWRRWQGAERHSGAVWCPRCLASQRLRGAGPLAIVRRRPVRGCGGVAQLAEQRAFNPQREGSIPSPAIMTRSSFPDDRDTLARPGDYRDTPLFAPQPPSGPQTAPPPRAMNRYAAYSAWKRSEEGAQVFGWMLHQARKQLAAGQERIGVKALFEDARKEFRVELNNVWTHWVSDDLVAADPTLLPVIERRVRKTVKA